MSIRLFSTDSLLADKAASTEQQDSFQRYPFARHLANTICERRSPESLVIGLYGEWGAGKSSVLNFIRAELANTDVLTVYFNPWRFDGEEQLLFGFFAELSMALQQVVTAEAKQAAQRAIVDYTKTVVTKLQMFERDAQVDSLKDFKSQAKLEEVKRQINELLRTSGKRVLVLIDDIDRLSAPEMHAILRLVKLTGDFHYTTYLLAFDEQVVAQAMGEHYAGGRKRNGLRYLEKIIQVPLHLPVIQKAAMEKYFQECLSLILYSTNTQLPEGEYERLIAILAASILPCITTPRHITRYSNTLLVVLPLLKREANAVDLMLLEALKQFYPKLYKLVSHQQRLLTGAGSTTDRADKGHYNAVFGLEGALLGQARYLLNSLFPKIEKAYGGDSFSSLRNASEDTLYAHQAVASAYYFRRYFSYAVQEGEIPETSFAEFLAAMARGDAPGAQLYAINMIERASDVEFLRRLERQVSDVTAATSATYCELLSVISDKFTPNATSDRAMRPFSRTSSLLLSYLNLLPAATVVETIIHVLVSSQNLTLAYELLRDITSMGHWSDDTPLENFKTAIAQDTYDLFNRIIIDRVLLTISAKQPWYMAFKHGALDFLNIWYRGYGKKNTTADALRKIFDQEPKELQAFLERISPALQTKANPEPRYLSLDLEIYNKLKDFIDIDYLYQVARSLVEGEAPIAYNNNPRHEPTMIERIHQFLHLYGNDIERIFED